MRVARIGRAVVRVLLRVAGSGRCTPGAVMLVVMPVAVHAQRCRRPVLDQQRQREDDKTEQAEEAHRAAFNHRHEPKRRGI